MSNCIVVTTRMVFVEGYLFILFIIYFTCWNATLCFVVACVHCTLSIVLVFTVQWYASMVYTVVVCLSIRLPQVIVLLIWLNIGSRKQCHMIAQPKISAKFELWAKFSDLCVTNYIQQKFYKSCYLFKPLAEGWMIYVKSVILCHLMQICNCRLSLKGCSDTDYMNAQRLLLYYVGSRKCKSW